MAGIAILLAAVGSYFAIQWNKKPKVQVFQPSGPIVQVPAAILFQGSADAADKMTPRKVSPDEVIRVQRALYLRPRDRKVLNDAGSVFGAVGQLDQGNRLLAEALKHAPNDPVINYNYARGLYQQGKVSEAIQFADNALRLQPRFDEARLLRSAAAIQQRDYNSVEDILKLVNKGLAIALVTDGVIKLSKGKVQEGLNEFQQALKLAPKNPTALYNSGVASQMQNNLPAAENFYRQAIASDPELAEAHNNLGTILAGRGNEQAAFEEFHQAAFLNPDDKSFLDHFSKTSHEQGERRDKLAGDWLSQGGSIQISGTIQGQPGSQSATMPAGSRLKFTKASEGVYRWDEDAMGQKITTTVTQQGNGSFSGPAVTSVPGMPQAPGVTDTGTVSFWVRGDTLFGDTTDTATGPGINIKSTKTWKAQRVQ